MKLLHQENIIKDHNVSDYFISEKAITTLLVFFYKTKKTYDLAI